MKFTTKFGHDINIDIDQNGTISQSMINHPLQLSRGRILASLSLNQSSDVSEYIEHHVDVTHIFKSLELTSEIDFVGQSNAAVLGRILTQSYDGRG